MAVAFLLFFLSLGVGLDWFLQHFVCFSLCHWSVFLPCFLLFVVFLIVWGWVLGAGYVGGAVITSCRVHFTWGDSVVLMLRCELSS